jgi:hypothetical protein
MQVKIKKSHLNKKVKILINYFLGPLLFILLSCTLYRQIINRPNVGTQWQQIKSSWMDSRLWLVVFLMLVNWGIEARKWQKLVHHVQPFSYLSQCYRDAASPC